MLLVMHWQHSVMITTKYLRKVTALLFFFLFYYFIFVLYCSHTMGYPDQIGFNKFGKAQQGTTFNGPIYLYTHVGST